MYEIITKAVDLKGKIVWVQECVYEQETLYCKSRIT